jgi:hypothetical protein
LKALPVVAVAAGVGKLALSIMESSQAGDTLANAIAAGKTSIDSFFSAISTGDWSAFNDGISGAISNARELAETLDSLADIELANRFVTAEYEAALANARSVMNDSTVSEKEKADALDAVRIAQQRAIAVNEDYITGTKNAIIQTYKAQTGIEQTVDNILEYIRSGYNLDALKDEYRAMINELTTEIKGRQKLTKSSGNLAHRTKAYREQTKAMQLQLGKYIDLYNAGVQWGKFNDDERSELEELAVKQLKSTVAIDNMTKAYNRLVNAQDKASKSKEPKEGKERYKSLKDLEEEADVLREKI